MAHPGARLAGLASIPGGMVGVGGGLLGVLIVLGVLANQGGPAQRAEFNREIERFCTAVAAGIGRYVSGRELSGVPRSEATWWRAGAPLPDDRRGESPLGLVGGRLSLRKPPRPSRRRGLRMLAAPVPMLVHGLAGPVRVAAVWHRWPLAARSAARLAPFAVGWGAWRCPGQTSLAMTSVAVAVLIAALTGPSGLGWWHRPTVWTDGQVYGPGLWAALRQILRLAEDEPRSRWLSVPDDMSAEGARIVLRLPVKWVGGPEGVHAVERVVTERAPGQWQAHWERTRREHYVRWTLKPPPAPDPELPALVEWIPSPEPGRVHLGAGHEGPVFVNTGGETPHWGVSGGTGDGKTTVLLIPIVHARQHGALVDAITMKSNAFQDIEGESGIRVHTSGRAAVAALAEFYVSMKAAEALKGTPQGDALPARVLVIDEFASFVKSAKIWWKYGIGGKGMPPFEAWFHMVLMQGRSADHKMVIGAHTFTRELFGDTETRDLVGTKGIVGPASHPKWLVTYGASPRVPYDHQIKGRGVIGITGVEEVREIQYAYITPHARRHLGACAPAPDWHAQGRLAPWITPAAREEAEQELAIAAFLPGGAYMRGVTLVTDPETSARTEVSHSSEHVTPPAPTAPVTSGVTDPEQPPAPPNTAEPEPPGQYTLREACELRILPTSYPNARQRLARSRKDGIPGPVGTKAAGTTRYTATELTTWWQLVTTTKPSQQPGE
ncbi:hypothetical protein [Streptomyces sp. NPDC089919]|uniref:type IV secretory system conjugative DNA transfer family protein n=1 Tax=Streptomyces sp. NPDC089919 TaxID=3155188 RepID=UPI0034158638